MPTPDPAKLKQLREHRQAGIVFAVAPRPDTAEVYLAGSDFAISRGDLALEKPTFTEIGKHESYVTSLCVAGSSLVSGGYDGRLLWWDTKTDKQVRTVDAHEKWIRDVKASPDGSIVASVADDMACRLWDAEGKQLAELKGHAEETPNHFRSMLYACAFSPDGKYIATGDKAGKIVVWEVATGEQRATLEAPVMYTWDPKARVHSIGGIRSLAFSPDGNTLAVGGMGQVGNIDHLQGKARVIAFDWKKGERTLEFESGTFKGLVERLIWAPDGKWLSAFGGDHGGFLIFMDPAGDKGKGKVIREEKYPAHVHDAAFTADGKRLYIAAHQKASVYEF